MRLGAASVSVGAAAVVLARSRGQGEGAGGDQMGDSPLPAADEAADPADSGSAEQPPRAADDPPS